MITYVNQWKQATTKDARLINSFQHSFAFQIVTGHLICTANQIARFYIKRNAGLKWVKPNLKFYMIYCYDLILYIHSDIVCLGLKLID